MFWIPLGLNYMHLMVQCEGQRIKTEGGSKWKS